MREYCQPLRAARLQSPGNGAVFLISTPCHGGRINTTAAKPATSIPLPPLADAIASFPSPRRGNIFGMRRVRSQLLLAGIVAGACGARTPLNVDLCPTDGELRTCNNDCGQGRQVCIAGLWSTCDVPPAERSCTNDCGEGMQQCRDGRWRTCMVAPTTRGCSNTCGDGVESCVAGEWGECDVPDAERACASVCGSGVERCSDGMWQACDAPQPKPPVLEATVRDFLDTHPDFESGDGGGRDPGIVATRLGDDGKPVYADPSGRTETTSGQTSFDQWYRDVAGVNQPTTISVPLADSGADGVFSYDDDAFFPVDGQLLGNQGRSHNYHFTLELHTEFRYNGGEVFTFTGDDDLWVFINGWLAIDLGGTHTPLSDSVSLDRRAGELGIEPGGIYAFDLFFAERHTIESNFHIETTISEFANCD